jgi:hypothetical protein
MDNISRTDDLHTDEIWKPQLETDAENSNLVVYATGKLRCLKASLAETIYRLRRIPWPKIEPRQPFYCTRLVGSSLNTSELHLRVASRFPHERTSGLRSL